MIVSNYLVFSHVFSVVCILSGGNIDQITLTRCIERGLSAEGRLVKFGVNIIFYQPIQKLGFLAIDK